VGGLTLLGLGALGLAGPAARPAGTTARLCLGVGALLAAALAKALLVAWLPDGASPWLGYDQPSLYLVYQPSLYPPGPPGSRRASAGSPRY
jgi:hypothetical protein